MIMYMEASDKKRKIKRIFRFTEKSAQISREQKIGNNFQHRKSFYFNFYRNESGQVFFVKEVKKTKYALFIFFPHWPFLVCRQI